MKQEREALHAILKEMMLERRVRITSSSEFKRKLGRLSKKTGISTDELREVFEPVIRGLFEEMIRR